MPRKPEPLPEAKVYTAPQVAKLFGHTQPWLKENLPRLLQHGFPAPDRLLNRWHRAAVEKWFAERAGVESDFSPCEAEAIRRIHENQAAIPSRL
jgi:predicted DNA-binding transcriptional regulator AlpA